MPHFERLKLRDQVANALIDLIETAGLHDGDVLPSERALVVQLGVSRTVIREAMSLLEVRGVLGIDQGKKARIAVDGGHALRDELRILSRIRPAALWDLFEVRTMFEPQVAALAARRRDPSALAAMRSAVETMRKRLSEPEGYVQADVDFHTALLRGSGNHVLERLMRPVNELLLTSRKITASRRRPTRAALEEHDVILAAVERSDPVQAEAAMKKHLAATEHDLVAAIGPRNRAPSSARSRRRQSGGR